ncbi:uncharacterized protein LOC119735465 [Patiria miniata]|uniref:Tyrosine specific protein phosphatases domain-containing protein n=1 Tax=Patiria miniata TaxID=46514 RepID=A0A914ANA9_PATMI|nr:uncharacterized protein LOC119735465 [Patiria miniata]
MSNTVVHRTTKPLPQTDEDVFGNEQERLECVYNFRRIDAHGKLYRSARQDVASEGDLRHLHRLGIRTYLDLRNGIEYRNSLGRKKKTVDGEVRVVEPVLPDPREKIPYPNLSSVPLKGLDGKPTVLDGSPTATPTRYLIDMFPKELILAVFNTAPLYKRLFSLLLLLLDVILGNHYKYFVRCFSGEINRLGLVGRYVNILEHCGKQLCFVLNTLSNPENLPAVICCAHGKDRTGLVTAMVLSILGKSDEYIAQEYALSEEGLRPIQKAVREETSLKYNMDESFAWAKKNTMLEVLHTLRERYGSVEAFLEASGFTKKNQEKLRQVLS